MSWIRIGRVVVTMGLAIGASVGAVAAAVQPQAGPATGTLVTVASPASPLSQNKQNEPAVAIHAHNPSVVVARSNDNIYTEACKPREPATCPFTHGIRGAAA